MAWGKGNALGSGLLEVRGLVVISQFCRNSLLLKRVSCKNVNPFANPGISNARVRGRRPGPRFINWETRCKLGNLFADFLFDGRVSHVGKNFRDSICD